MDARTRILLGITVGLIVLVALAACGPGQAQLPPTTPPASAPAVLPSPTAAVATPGTPAPADQATTSGFQPGTLLTNESRQRIYYIAAGGAARRIENWMTCYALGFQNDAALTVDDALLNRMPPAAPLTRHLYDDKGYHYWAVDGALWAIDAWQPALTTPTYRGVPATSIDPLLLVGMPLVKTIPDDILLRDGARLYVKQGGLVYPVADSSVYQAFGYKFNQAVEIPHGALAERDAQPPLTRFLRDGDQIYEIAEGQRRLITLQGLAASGASQADVRQVEGSFLNSFPLTERAITLRVTSQAVNLRQGPGTAYRAAGPAAYDDSFVALSRTADNSWFKVRYQGTSAWVPAGDVAATGDIDNLPIANVAVVNAAAVPKPQPAAVATATLTPIQSPLCDTVPIRGFGKVWADHLEVQGKLNCPTGGEQATQATLQDFQHGFMVWVEQDRAGGKTAVYAFFDDNTYRRFDAMRPVDPAAVGSTPSGFHTVGDKFSAIYWEGTGAQVKERLGNATDTPLDSAGAFQPFRKGRMVWLGAIKRIIVVVDSPIGWTSFADTF